MSTFRNIEDRRKEVLKFIRPGNIVVVFDTETTGLDPKAEKIIQFSAAKVLVNKDLSFKLIDSVDIYINPEKPLPVEYDKKGKVKFSIAELTGITDEQLKDKPNENICFPVICKFMEDADVWVAHNIAFDIEMLRETSNRTRFYLEERPMFDTLLMARDLIPEGEVSKHKLCVLTEYLFPEENISFHNAYNDVEATVKIFNYFLKQYYSTPEKKEQKRTVRLISASYYDSPYAYDRRIRLSLSDGNYGDIYYDMSKQPRYWKHKKTSKAERLFDSIDMADIERQFMNKYGYRFGCNTMDEAADSFAEWSNKQKRNA